MGWRLPKRPHDDMRASSEALHSAITRLPMSREVKGLVHIRAMRLRAKHFRPLKHACAGDVQITGAGRGRSNYFI
ncbi:hypothetical protein GCM10009304_25130 [Pseudomonas matsuisoli]|uniref:Uncharacterized protein n=1 Tax=Pseudomonas matsuisoli TaxID=1515666 RepID=A0A917UZ30_9PSED|nr:hypothetical protein GCM10009304_25130 [Pseudomonas matsuisoli]